MDHSAKGSLAVEQKSGLDNFFKITESGSTVSTELVAGATTFMVMAYIIFVNPAILSFAGIKDLQGLGPAFPAVMAGTCLVAGLLTIFMGLYSNYPFALAPGMGLNAVVAFQLIVGMKLPWQAAMGVIFLEGVCITILVVTGFREVIMNAIPMALKKAIGVGIGLFIFFIGLTDGELIKWGSKDIGTPVALGNLTTGPVLVAIVGIFVTVWLMARKVRGSLLIGIVTSTVLAIIINYATGMKTFTSPGVAVIPSSLVALPDLSLIGQGINLVIFAKVGFLTAVLTIFSLMLSDFFDTMGTVIGIGGEAGWLDKAGRLPRLNRVLLVDSIAAIVGGAASTSSATTYIESAAGVSEGGRTGLTAVVVGVLFLLAMFFSPIAGIVPAHATAPALIIVGFLMAAVAKEIPFSDLEEGLPALLTIAIMPFTYSITNGIGVGFITYTFLKVVVGKAGQIHWGMYVASLAFLVYFALPWLHIAFGI
ncbi:MAG: NCS2 family permease [Actinobacteria bacterium]|nr:NCS2 family permease [Actinomycetota bacterium]